MYFQESLLHASYNVGLQLLGIIGLEDNLSVYNKALQQMMMAEAERINKKAYLLDRRCWLDRLANLFIIKLGK